MVIGVCVVRRFGGYFFKFLWRRHVRKSWDYIQWFKNSLDEKICGVKYKINLESRLILSNFINNLSNILDSYSRTYDNIVIMGDFNDTCSSTEISGLLADHELFFKYKKSPLALKQLVAVLSTLFWQISDTIFKRIILSKQPLVITTILFTRCSKLPTNTDHH